MKSKHLFWGLFFISIGTCFFINKYDLINLDWSAVLNIWPLIIILWGVAIIFKENQYRPYISGASGLVFGLTLFALFASLTFDFTWSDEEYVSGDYSTQYTEDYSDSIKYAKLVVETGAGRFFIKEPSELLIEAKQKSRNVNYDYSTFRRDSSVSIFCELDNIGFPFFKGKRIKNVLSLHLNTKPIWEMQFKIGASNVDLDLAPYKVNEIKVESGASDIKIKLGELTENIDLDIDMGAASVEILIPKNSGCKISGDMVIMTKHFEGFNREDDNFYKTTNFDDAKNKISIKINGGVSSVSVVRY